MKKEERQEQIKLLLSGARVLIRRKERLEGKIKNQSHFSVDLGDSKQARAFYKETEAYSKRQLKQIEKRLDIVSDILRGIPADDKGQELFLRVYVDGATKETAIKSLKLSRASGYRLIGKIWDNILSDKALLKSVGRVFG